MKKFWKHKSKLAAIALVLLMASVLLTLYVPVNAQILGEGEPGGVPGPLAPGVVPNYTIKVWAFLSFRPNPVGLGQPILVNLETQPAPGVNRMHQDYTVTITDPDGNEDVYVIDSYPDDGTMWFEYVPDQLGTWTLKFDFLGTYFPAGRYNDGIGPPAENITTGGTLFTESVYFEPASSPTQNLVVQEELVGSWPPSELPTDYWTRPVPFDRREWWPVIGNYPWHGPAGGPYTVGLAEFEARYPDTNRYRPGHSERGVFTPWVLGPESAHVAWKRQITESGILGGDYGTEVTMANIFGGMGLGGDPSGYGYPEIIWAGRAYHTFSEPGSGPTPKLVWECYDIRTGETYWKMDAPYIMALIRGVLVPASVTPTAIEYNIGAIPSGGGFPTHVTETTLVYIGRGSLIKYRPVTGAVRANVSIAPLTSGKYYMNGHALSVQNVAGQRYLINWTTLGTTSNFASRVISNITWPWTSLPDTVDFNTGIAATVQGISEAGAYSKIRIRAASLKTGAELWDKTITGALYSGHTCIADHGKIALLTLNQGFFAFDLQTGNLAWQSEPMEYPWDASAFGGYSVQSAYGLLYRQAYSGIYAFDWDDGTIAWKYEAPANYPYETPYVNEEGETMYSWNIGAIIADGKMYAYNTEHSATLPITRGWGLHCINATSGEGIWEVDIPGAASKHNPDVKAIADGYLPMMSSDGYMYIFGKGKTKTTVEAPLTAISLGQSVVIKGTVLDMSPAQPGTAAVSKESMGPWMEHLHLQRPIPADVVGVPVSLDTIDPNGNFIHIADVTSDFTGTFSYLWTPEIPGKFTVMASFMGDDSYGSSYAETAVGVMEAPEPYPEPPEYGSPEWPEYPEADDDTPMFLGLIVAVAVAIVIGLVNLWALRKR